jgi:hypothetical protein
VNLYLALYSHIRARKALRAKKARAPNRSRQRLVWADRLRELTEAGFTSRYRMSKQTFHKLVGLLKQTEEERAPVKNRHSNPISLELKLSMTLRALAGGSVYDVADLHKVGVSTFRRAFKYTVTLINECLAIVFPINDEAKLADIATNFSALSGGIFKGVVLAVDGVLIKISKPSYNGTQYFSRKGFYGLNVQAGVDSDRRILYLTVRMTVQRGNQLSWLQQWRQGNCQLGIISWGMMRTRAVGSRCYARTRAETCPMSRTSSTSTSHARASQLSAHSAS